jgi:hypothetical protein
MALLSRNKKTAATKGTANAGGAKGKPQPKDKPPRGARLKQIRTAWSMTRSADAKLLPYTLAAFFGPLLLMLAVGLVIGPLWFFLPMGIMVALLATTFVFGRRVQKAAFAGVEGQAGAAAAILNAMRGDWRITPAVGVNRDQELCHRVLGRPGIALVAEPGPSGVHRGTRNLIANEKRRLTRVVGDTPVYEILVGDDEGQIPLRQLEKHFAKLPRNIKPKRVNELDAMLKALPSNPLPIPKGPIPKSGRIPRGKVR